MARRRARRWRVACLALAGAAIALYLGYEWTSRALPPVPDAADGDDAPGRLELERERSETRAVLGEAAPDPGAGSAQGAAVGDLGSAPSPAASTSPPAEAQARRGSAGPVPVAPAPREDLSDADRRALEEVLDRAGEGRKKP